VGFIAGGVVNVTFLDLLPERLDRSKSALRLFMHPLAIRKIDLTERGQVLLARLRWSYGISLLAWVFLAVTVAMSFRPLP
jgi:hypothetical protein